MKIRLLLLSLLLITTMSSDSYSTLMQQKAHHTKTGFKNNYPHDNHGFSKLFKWQWNRIGKPATKIVEFTVLQPDTAFLKANKHQPSLTWIGHSSFLLQINGTNILTDPIVSDRCSPVTWAGPKRHAKPALLVADLPQIDIVIISHDHYDHMDFPTLEALFEQQKTNPPTFYVPLKVKERFSKAMQEHIVEMDWWDALAQDHWNINCVPVQHFSGRSVNDRNSTLWAGWVLQTGGFDFFFAGDTGYSNDFKDISARFPNGFDLSLIPVGAYEPRWFMSSMHVDPSEAVKIHEDVKSRFSVGMHWGTFVLTDEDMDEPPRLLREEMEKRPDAAPFIVVQHGQTLDLSGVASRLAKAAVSTQ